MCNDNERKLRKTEKSNLKFGYKVFEKNHLGNYIAPFQQYIYKPKDWNTADKGLGKTGRILTRILFKDVGGFHVFINAEHAKQFAKILSVDYKDYVTFVVCKVEVAEPIAIGEIDCCSYGAGVFGKDSVFRCKKVKIIEEVN